MADFWLKRGDLLPTLRVVLTDEDGEPEDLTTAEGVEIRIKLPESGTVLLYDAVIADADDGVVTYSWQEGDSDEVGPLELEFIVTYPGGKTKTWPSCSFVRVQVAEILS